MSRRKRFNNKKTAQEFANKVGGSFNDLTNDVHAKAPYSVTYTPSEKTRSHGQMRCSGIEKPAILPSGAEGSEWDDYAWSADDY